MMFKRPWKLLAAAACHCSIALVMLAALTELSVRAVDLPDFSRLQRLSHIAVASDGHLLCAFLASDDTWRFATSVEEVDLAWPIEVAGA